MLNSIVLIGNLVRDPELQTTQSNVPVCKFTIAVTRKYKNQNDEYEADFIPIVFWREKAEVCNTYLKKGNKVAVRGSLQVRNYEDKEGRKRTIAEVLGDEVDFLTPKEQKPVEKVETFPEVDQSDLPF